MTWTISVVVGGIDVSARVVGQCQVTAEENQARTATVSYVALSGVYVPEDLVGVGVEIAYKGSRIFTGQCDWPSLDQARGILTLRCSDMLQQHFEALDDAGILAAIPGSRLSDEIFGTREDGWQRTQDALSTVRSEVHRNASGVIVVAPWESQSGTHAYDETSVVDQSARVTFAEYRQIVNDLQLSFKYRFSRFKVREHSYTWPGWSSNFAGKAFCEWRSDGYPLLPKREQFEDTAQSAGWPIVDAINFGRLPGAGLYQCPEGPVIWLGIREEDGSPADKSAQSEGNDYLVTGAGWLTRKRFAQTITEDYTLTVSSAGSIGLFGSLPGEDGAVYDAPAENGDWESSEETDIPPTFAQDAIGDWFEDQDDRIEANNTVQCLLQIADARIAGSHRKNYVEWQTECDPVPDLADKASISVPNVSATGKIVQIKHILDVNQGRAITIFKIACFRGGGGFQEALEPPPVPPSAPTHPAPPSGTSVLTYLGGQGGSPPWSDPGGSYVSTNVQTIFGAVEIYPRRVQIVGPDIEQEARDNFDAPQAHAYSIAVPDDPLTVSVP